MLFRSGGAGGSQCCVPVGWAQVSASPNVKAGARSLREDAPPTAAAPAPAATGGGGSIMAPTDEPYDYAETVRTGSATTVTTARAGAIAGSPQRGGGARAPAAGAGGRVRRGRGDTASVTSDASTGSASSFQGARGLARARGGPR